jgi:yecA family protein
MTITVDYDEVNAELMALHAGVLASECHGFMCGYFCASNTISADVWQNYLLVEMDDATDLEHCFAMLLQLANQVTEAILSDEFSFTPLLPDDNSAFSERATALAEWSAGFVSGLGIGGLAEKPKLIDECDEFIKDLISISRIETAVDEGDDVEGALFEIVEYIRVGVIMLHQEWHHPDENASGPEVLH